MSAPGSGQQGSSTRHRGTANGSILSFFQPIPNDDRSTRQSAPNAHYKLSRSPPSSPPIGHIKAAPEPVKTEIAASDDEVDGSDGDRSDDSLEDLSCLLGRPKGSLPARQPSQHDPLATPKAKRTAVEFHSSPLAIMPRHKFDFKALAKDARRDFATTASSLKIKPGGTYITESKDGVAVPSSESVAKLLVQDGDGHDGQDAQKLLRAVKRSEPSHGLPRYCFFEQAYEMPPPAAAPKLPKNSPWLLLTEGNLNTKEQHLVSGLPQTILRKCGGLPDELFEWILSSLCVHPSFIMRQEYSNMVTYCNEQTGRLITAERINTMFRLLGAKISNTGNSSLALSALDSDPYRDRDWSCLQTVLTLLGVVAPDLSVPSVETAARILVQLALDKFLISNAGLLAEYEFAMKQLLKALPSPSWDEFCFETCYSLQNGPDNRSIKVTALLCIPICSARTHDLRRRLATTTLLHNANLGRQNTQNATTLKELSGALEGVPFTIGADTNFAEFRASVVLLDMAVDDGFVTKFESRGEEAEFNAAVDELSTKLREMWRKINDAGMKLARTEAKSVVEWVQQRLSHNVRTRRKMRASVFDAPGHQREDSFLPQQREYMKKFLQRPSKPSEEGREAATDRDITVVPN